MSDRNWHLFLCIFTSKERKSIALLDHLSHTALILLFTHKSCYWSKCVVLHTYSLHFAKVSHKSLTLDTKHAFGSVHLWLGQHTWYFTPNTHWMLHLYNWLWWLDLVVLNVPHWHACSHFFATGLCIMYWVHSFSNDYPVSQLPALLAILSYYILVYG